MVKGKEGQSIDRSRKKDAVKTSISDLRSVAEDLLARAEKEKRSGTISDVEFDDIKADQGALVSAVDHLLALPDLSPTDLENLNTFTEALANSLPKSLQGRLFAVDFDEEALNREGEGRRKTELLERLTSITDAIEDGLNSFKTRLDSIQDKVDSKVFKELSDTRFRIQKDLDEAAAEVDKTNIIDEEKFEAIRIRAQDFALAVGGLIDQSYTPSKVDVDGDSWLVPPDGGEVIGGGESIGTNKTIEMSAEELIKATNLVTENRERLEREMKRINDRSLVSKEAQVVLDRETLIFLSVLDEYLAVAKRGETGEKDAKAIRDAAREFFGKIKQIKERLIKIKLEKTGKESTIDRVVEKVEKELKDIKNNKSFSEKDLAQIKDEYEGWNSGIGVYLDKVKNGEKLTEEDKRKINTEANYFLTAIAKSKSEMKDKTDEEDVDVKAGKAASVAAGVSPRVTKIYGSRDDEGVDDISGGASARGASASSKPPKGVDDDKEPLSPKTTLGPKAVASSDVSSLDVSDTTEVVDKKAELEKQKAEKKKKEQEFWDKAYEARNRVREISDLVESLEKDCKKDIPHAEEFLPDYKKVFEDVLKKLGVLRGAAETFFNFFKGDLKRKSHNDLLDTIEEVQRKFEEVSGMRERVDEIKKQATELEKKKKEEAKEKDRLQKEAEAQAEKERKEKVENTETRLDTLFSGLNKFGVLIQQARKHPFYNDFDSKFLIENKKIDDAFWILRDAISEAKILAKDLHGKYKADDFNEDKDKKLFDELLPKIEADFATLEPQMTEWGNLYTETKKHTEEVFKNLYDETNVVKDDLKNKHQIVEIYYKNLRSMNNDVLGFVFPGDGYEQQREDLMSAGRDAAIQEADKFLSEQEKWLSGADKKMVELQDNKNWTDKSHEDVLNIKLKANWYDNLQEERLAVLPELLSDSIGPVVAKKTTEISEIDRLFSEFHPSDAAAQEFGIKMTSLEMMVRELSDFRNKLSDAVDDNPEQIQALFDKYNDLLKDIDGRIVDLAGNLESVKKELYEKAAQEKIASATKKKAKKVKAEKEVKKSTKKEPIVPPAIPLVSEPAPQEQVFTAEHLSLRGTKAEARKEIENILEKVGVIDVSPGEIVKYFSDGDFEELKKMIDTEREDDFKDFISVKIQEHFGFFAAETKTTEEIKENISEEVYETLKDILEHQVENEFLKKDGLKKLSRAKMVGKALANVGAALGIGGLAGASIASGGLAAAVAGGGIVAFRKIFKFASETAVGKAVESGVDKTLGRLFGWKAAERDEKTEQKYWENAVDEHITKDKIAVVLSNALRTNTTEAWMEKVPDLVQVLSTKKTEPIPPEKYKRCLDALNDTGLQVFFKNALNYVNVSPEFKSLPVEVKVTLAQTMALTIGQGYKEDVRMAEEFSQMEEDAQIKGKASWLAEKYFHLMSGFDKIKTGEFLSQHQGDEKWGSIAGSAWAVTVGGALAGSMRSASLTARVLGGAAAGAGVGLSIEQSTRRSAQEKLILETEKMVEQAEKDLMKLEKLPIEKISYARLNQIATQAADMQSKIDLGLIKNKYTRGRIDGLVYRVRKMESEKAMEMEKTLDQLVELNNIVRKNNDKIVEAADKNLRRLSKAMRNKQPAYMIGGAIGGAILAAAASSDFREWVGEKAEQAVESLPPIPDEKTLETTTPVATQPVVKSAGSYATTPSDYKIPAEAITAQVEPITPAQNVEIKSDTDPNAPREDSDTASPLVEKNPIDQIMNKPQGENELALPEDNERGDNESALSPEHSPMPFIDIKDQKVWQDILNKYPQIKKDWDWITDASKYMKKDEEFNHALSEAFKSIIEEYQQYKSLDESATDSIMNGLVAEIGKQIET